MIIDTKTVIITLIIIAIVANIGLRLVRQFALEIAQENHQSNAAFDAEAQALQTKREMEADAAAVQAFAKVEPLLKGSTTTSIATKQKSKEDNNNVSLKMPQQSVSSTATEE